MNVSTVQPLTAASSALGGSGQSVVVYDGNVSETKPLTPAQVQAGNKVMQESVANASAVMDFMRTTFGRNGVDGKGAPLELVVHAEDPEVGGAMNNAYWHTITKKMYLGDGDGQMFAPLGLSKDIIAHELGHGILGSEVSLRGDVQARALNESFGDVLGVLVDTSNWQIGERSLTPNKPGDAVRDMSRPSVFNHMDETKGHRRARSPHDMADIPNLAALRVAEKIGRSDMGKVWYQGFTEHMPMEANFSEAAAATRKAAELIFGAGSQQANAVTDAWTSVGVLQTGD